jgi:hypothetical protein
MIEKDSFITGILLGVMVPILGYTIIEFLVDFFISKGWIDNPVSSYAIDHMNRTILLISICTILIPFQISLNKRWDYTMRGMILPTLIYVGAWVYKFYDQLFV